MKCILLRGPASFLCALGTAMVLSGCMSVSDTRISESTAPDNLKSSEAGAVTGIRTIVVTQGVTGSRTRSAMEAEAFARADAVCPPYENGDRLYRGYSFRSMQFHEGTANGAPWVELKIHCQTVHRVEISDPAETIIQSKTKGIDYSEFFDLHSETWPASVKATLKAVSKVLDDQGDPVFTVDQREGLATIVTGRARHGAAGFPTYEQYVVVLYDNGSGQTRMTFKLLSYHRDIGIARIDEMILKPSDRRYVYTRAAWFVDRVRGALR